MFRKVISVKFDRFFPQSEAQHDAHRCMLALMTRFPACAFADDQVDESTSEVFVTAMATNPSVLEELQRFAEGFLASRYLWER